MKEDDGAWFELSRILAAQGQLAKAQTALRRAIRLSSQPLVLYMTLARFELARNQPQPAWSRYSPPSRAARFAMAAKVFRQNCIPKLPKAAQQHTREWAA